MTEPSRLPHAVQAVAADSAPVPDPATPFGALVARLLRDEKIVWLSTIDRHGTPQTNPIWFVWDSAEVTCYSLPHAKRLTHIRHRPSVGLHFDSDGRGGRIVVIKGDARIVPEAPAANQDVEFVAKYSRFMRDRHGWSTMDFAIRYPIAIRVRPRATRGHV